MAIPSYLQPSARQILAIMVFWGQIQNYMMRSNLSLLIVAMTKDPIVQGNIFTKDHLFNIDII